MIPFDGAANQVLRRTAQLAEGRRATLDDLRRALEQPPTVPLPQSRLRGDAELAEALRQAGEIAGRRGAQTITRGDLVESVLAVSASAAGLDVQRLRFIRWRLTRLYLTAPALRRHSAHTAHTLLEEIQHDVH